MKPFFTLLFLFSIIFSTRAQFTKQLVDELMTDVQVVDNAISYAVGSSISGTDAGYLYKRTGNSSNFTVVNTFPDARFVGCHFFDAQNGLICGTKSSGRSYIWRTTDGGATFTERLISVSTSFYPTAFRFLTPNIGYFYTYSVVGGSKIYKTTDGGASWASVWEDPASLIKDMSFMVENVGYKLNQTAAQIEITRDGARTWQKINAPEKPISYNFINELTGFVGTSNGEIFKTTNGGTTWSRLIKFPKSDITQVKFPTPSVGYAIVTSDADRTYIYRTTDGGVTWRVVHTGSSNVFEIIDRLKCYNTNTVVAVGLGTIVASNNASTTTGVPLSSLFLSGEDINCTTVNMNMTFDLTGTPPWSVVLQGSDGMNKNFTATSTPFRVNYAPIPSPPVPFTFTPVSVKGAGETVVSTFVGGSAKGYYISNIDAAFVPQKRDTVCYNTPISFPIKLTGCPPWELSLYDQDRDTTIQNIQTANYTFNTRAKGTFNGENVGYIRIQSLSNSQGSRTFSAPTDETSVVLKAKPALAAFDFMPEKSFCLNTSATLPLSFEGLPPFNATITDGTESITVRSFRKDTALLLPMKRSSTWRFTRATDGCGTSSVVNTVDLKVRPIPKKPLDVAYSVDLTTFAESVNITWKDNNVNRGDTSYRYGVEGYTFMATYIEPGVQTFNQPLYDFFSQNIPKLYAVVTASNNFDCKISADTLFIPSPARVIKRDSFTQTPPNTGVALADMNNDKLPDVLAANGYFINKGNFVFEFRTQNFLGTPSVVGDLDNDGDLDFLVNSPADNTTKVYYNNGNFSFVLKQTLLGANATVFDYDFNGLLDIVCTGTVYRNAGDNRYLSMARLDKHGKIKGKPYYCDIDRDGKMDLIDVYVGKEHPFVGVMSFEWVTRDEDDNLWAGQGRGNGSGLEFVGTPQAISFGDIFALQGWDILGAFCAPYRGDFNRPNYATKSFMQFYGLGGTAGTSVQDDLEGHGEGALLDIDNDGELDVIDKGELALRLPYASDVGLISRDGFFSDGAPATADFDNDGDLDVAVALPSGGLDIFENKFNFGNKWLKIKLNAKSTNRAGLAVRIQTYFKDSGGTYRHNLTTVGTRHGGASRSDIVAHIGVEKTAIIDSIDIEWSPNKHTVLRGVRPNQFLTIDEPTTTIRPAYPINIKIVSANATQARLSWQDLATNEEGYIIQRSTVSPDSGFVNLDTLVANTITHLTPLRTGTYYRIYAFNSVAYSAYSNTVSLSTPSVCDLLTSVDTFFIAPEKLLSSCDSMVPLTVPQITGYQYQWLLNDKPIANATTRSFNATQSGIYGLKVKTAAGCTRLLAPIKLNISKNITPQLTVQYLGCNSETTILRTTPRSSDYKYTIRYRRDTTYGWTTVSTIDSFVAVNLGQYQTIMEHKLTGCTYESSIVAPSVGNRSAYTVEASTNPTMSCKKPVTLKNLSINTPNTVFTWLRINSIDVNNSDTMRINTPSLTVSNVNQNGDYVLFGRDTISGCKRYSEKVSVYVHYPSASYKVTEPTCFGNNGKILLNPAQNSIVVLEYKNTSFTPPWRKVKESAYVDSFAAYRGTYRVLVKSYNLESCDTLYPEFNTKDTSYTVTGKVTLPNGSPSVSSVVQLREAIDPDRNPDWYTIRATDTTDVNGRYQLKSGAYPQYYFWVWAEPNNQIMTVPTYLGNTTTTSNATKLRLTTCSVYSGNDIQLSSINISNRTTINSCGSFADVYVYEENKRNWFNLIDPSIGIVADINPNGNVLGQVSGGYFINSSGTIRRASGTPYLDRNIGIKVTNQPTTDVTVRLYFTERERAAYFAAVGANPVAVTHYAGALCLGNVQSGRGELLPAVVRSAPNGNYYVEFNTRRFSGFFIGPNNGLVFSRDINAESNKLRIESAFPLPVSTELAVTFTAHQRTEEGRIFITDILGKVVLDRKILIETGQNDTRLDMSALSNGLYFLNISDGVRQVSKKIVKQ